MGLLWVCNLMILTLVPGGRGEDSSVIITLPECSDFTDIPEDALAKVLTYLTLIPRCVCELWNHNQENMHFKNCFCNCNTFAYQFIVDLKYCLMSVFFVLLIKLMFIVEFFFYYYC